jgi:hypothetical protein
LLAVHLRTVVPVDIEVNELVGDKELEIVPIPEMTDQVPIPALKELAAKTVVGLLIQSVWFGPATAAAGIGSTCILIVDELAQPPLLTFHCKIFVPVPNAVTEVAAKVGLIIVPLPETKDQKAVPPVGEVAAKVVDGEFAHKVWLIPAVAV